MRSNWETLPLSQLCKFENGDRGKNYPGRKAFVDEGIPFINAGHLTDAGIDLENMNFISEQRYDLLSNGKIKEGDVLFCLRGSLGKYAIVEGITRGAIASSLVIVRPSDKLGNRFLAAYFESPLCQRMIETYRNGAAQPNLSAKALGQFLIPVPPLSEQQHIVTLLDEAFEGIAAATAIAEQNLKNARKLFDSYLENVFTEKGECWTDTPIENVAGVINGFAFKSKDFSPDYSVKSIKITNVGVREFVHNDTSLLPEGFDSGYPAVKIAKGSLVIALTRSIISTGLKVAVVPEEYDGALLNQRVAALSADETKVMQRFLYAFLCTKQVAEYVKKQANTLMQPNLSIKDLRSMPVPVAPPADQAKIVERIDLLADEAKRLEAIYLQKLAALSELKQSILQKAFAGELH